MVQKGLKEVGYSYVNVDDGFFGWRDERGVMQTHPERFPNGLKGVADHIHSLGLKAGIYSDAGSNTCGSIWDKDMNGIGSGLYGHEFQDATLYFKEWGFDFIKIDYCGAGQELNLEEEKRYTEIRQAIDNLGCGHVSINICRWAFPGTWARNIARSWRILSLIHIYRPLMGGEERRELIHEGLVNFQLDKGVSEQEAQQYADANIDQVHFIRNAYDNFCCF